jgi:hypothetical protein
LGGHELCIACSFELREVLGLLALLGLLAARQHPTQQSSDTSDGSAHG